MQSTEPVGVGVVVGVAVAPIAAVDTALADEGGQPPPPVPPPAFPVAKSAAGASTTEMSNISRSAGRSRKAPSATNSDSLPCSSSPRVPKDVSIRACLHVSDLPARHND